MAITRDNLHLSEPIPDAELVRQGCCKVDEHESLDPAICELLEAAAAPNTRRAYESDVRHFQAWGGSVPATPELVARYLAHHLFYTKMGRTDEILPRIPGIPNPTQR